MIICVWSTLHFNIPTRRHTPIRRFFLQVSWMAIALFAPEVLLFLAMNERMGATSLMKTVQEFHPSLIKPGMLSRVYKYIRGKLKDVSTSYHPPTN